MSFTGKTTGCGYGDSDDSHRRERPRFYYIQTLFDARMLCKTQKSRRIFTGRLEVVGRRLEGRNSLAPRHGDRQGDPNHRGNAVEPQRTPGDAEEIINMSLRAERGNLSICADPTSP
jgi:hypothetical protein